MATRTAPAARDLGAELAFLTRALKAPTLRQSVTRLAERARAELPGTIAFWQRHGYVEVDRDGPRLRMVHLLPVRSTLPTPECLGYGQRRRTANATFSAISLSVPMVVTPSCIGAQG